MNRQSNWQNDGRAFETAFERTVEAYHHARVLRMSKVEPPCRIFGGRVIWLSNPWPDFVGSWLERGGRMLAIEVKCTSEPKLPIAKRGHLSDNQIDWLVKWHHAGAAVGLLWHMKGQCVFLPIGRIVSIRKERRHLKWADGNPVAQGKGFILWDFVPHLRRWYPESGQSVQIVDIQAAA